MLRSHGNKFVLGAFMEVEMSVISELYFEIFIPEMI